MSGDWCTRHAYLPILAGLSVGSCLTPGDPGHKGQLVAAAPCAACGQAASLPHMNCANIDCNKLFLACDRHKVGPTTCSAFSTDLVVCCVAWRFWQTCGRTECHKVDTFQVHALACYHVGASQENNMAFGDHWQL